MVGVAFSVPQPASPTARVTLHKDIRAGFGTPAKISWCVTLILIDQYCFAWLNGETQSCRARCQSEVPTIVGCVIISLSPLSLIHVQLPFEVKRTVSVTDKESSQRKV
jgi:hypothetical protein